MIGMLGKEIYLIHQFEQIGTEDAIYTHKMYISIRFIGNSITT